MHQNDTAQRIYYSPLQQGGGYASGSYSSHVAYIEKLKEVNEELRNSRRAALNLMQDAILSKDALRESEEKYRNKLEQEVRDRTAELRESREQYASLVANTPDIITRWNRQFRMIFANKAIESGTGSEIEKLFGQPGKDLTNPAKLPADWLASLTNVFVTGNAVEHYHTFAAPEGEVYFFSRLVPERNEAGEVETVLAIARDITELRSTEREVLRLKDEIAQKATDKYINLFNTMDEGFVLIEILYDQQGRAVDQRYVDANPAFEKQTGVNIERILGKKESEVFPKVKDRSFQLLAELVKKGETERFEHFLHQNNRWYEVSAFPMSPTEVAVLFNDITKRKKAEAQLRESEELKAYLLQLSDAVGSFSDPGKIQYVSMAVLARRLGVCRTEYVEKYDDEGYLYASSAYTKEDTATPVLVAPLADIAPYLPAVIKAGTTLAIDDLLNSDDQVKRTERLQEYRAFICVPCIRDNSLLAAISVLSSTPRHWTHTEIEMAVETMSRTWAAIDRARTQNALRENRELLSRELQDTIQLQKISNKIIEEDDEITIYHDIVNSACEIMHAELGALQTLDSNGNLLLLAERGFHQSAVDQWKIIRADSTSSCGYAYREQKRIIITDLFNSQYCMTEKDLYGYRMSGVKAMQTTPLISRSGRFVGMISTHWKHKYDPSERELRFLDVLGRQAADLIERKTSEESLRQSEERLQLSLQGANIFTWEVNLSTGQVILTDNASLVAGFDVAGNAIDNLAYVYEPDKTLVVETVRIALENNYPIDLEIRITHPDMDDLRWVKLEGRIIKNRRDGSDAFIGIVQNINTRKNAQELLKENEQRVRTLTDAVPQIIWTNDRKGVADFFNQRWYEYSGLSEEESLGKGWEEIVHPNDAEISKRKWQEALAAGIIFDIEYRLCRNDGQYRWHIGRNIPLKDSQGKISGWFGSATDIDDLKKAEEGFRLTQARLKATMNAAIDYAIITTDLNGLITAWSDGATKIFGYSEAEVTGRHVSIIFTVEDITSGIPEQELSIARISGSASDERWHVRKDGSRFFMSGVMARLYQDEGSGFVKVARDMTQQRLEQENIQSLEERYRIALQSAEMAAWDWNIIDDVIEWNEQHYVLLGLQPDTQKKKSADFFKSLYSEDKDFMELILKQAVTTTGIYKADFRIVRDDNKMVRWMSGYGKVMSYKDNAAIRMVGVMYDITERKQLEQQKEDFISIASHELKTPVTSIRAYADLLSEEFYENENSENSKLIDKLTIQVDKLIDLIHALLDTSKISFGNLELHKESFDLNELIDECMEYVQFMPITHKLLHKPENIGAVVADRERIGQVLTNLISNATKYSPFGTEILVSCSMKGEEVMVSVRDQGIGISEEMRSRVFERFFRVHDPQSPSQHGMGLGLYITANIVERHGGRIWVESEPGKGSTFCFTLPAAG
jgi:PAS domain S-box-containing protein